MPTLQASLKDATSRKRFLKRVIVVTSLVISNVASYVVGNDGISVMDIARVVVTSLLQGVAGN
jgi:hypothetical protein